MPRTALLDIDLRKELSNINDVFYLIFRNRRKSRSESRAESKKAKLLKKLKKRRLVFLDESPDYCRPNSTAGFPGIIGRYVTSEPGSESGNRGSNSGGGGASRRRQSRSTRHQFKVQLI